MPALKRPVRTSPVVEQKTRFMHATFLGLQANPLLDSPTEKWFVSKWERKRQFQAISKGDMIWILGDPTFRDDPES